MSDIDEKLGEIDSALRVTLQHMSPEQPNIRKGLVEAVRNLRDVRQIMERQHKTSQCKWSHDGDTDSWDTECGEKWQFNEGGPQDNKCHFCPYCGGTVEAAYKHRSDGPCDVCYGTKTVNIEGIGPVAACPRCSE